VMSAHHIGFYLSITPTLGGSAPEFPQEAKTKRPGERSGWVTTKGAQ
jgi:hypothetical protein